MLSKSQLIYVDISLLTFAVICFANMFFHQVRLVFNVIRPFKSEDDVRAGPVRIIGPAKGQRIADFISKPDPTGLRGQWVRSWVYVVFAFLLVFVWAGVVRDVAAA